MTAQQLKNSILQLAISGKLVPQNPNDEPASVLLERIRAEKERLIKEGKIKKDKKPSVIFKGSDNTPYEKVGNAEPVSIADEVPFEIPESWEWCRASSLGSMIRGKGIKRTETVSSGYPCVRYGEIYTTYDTSFTEAISFIPKDIDEQSFHFSTGDVIYTLTGENKVDIAKSVAFLGKGAIAAGGDLAFWTAHGMDPLYLVYYMASPYCIEQKRRTATGDIIVHISTGKVGDFLIPVPPVQEQHRIVEQIKKIEPLLKQYSNCENKLTALNNAFPEKLKKSILQIAVQGKLIPQNLSDEPASVLLERIRAEKERLIKEGKIKRNKNESVIFRRDNSHYEKLGKNEACIDDEIPFELPDSWVWIRLSSILSSTDAGKSPQCKDRPRAQGEWGVIKTTAVQDAHFLENENKVLPDGFEIPAHSVICSGDLLITRAGPRNRTGIMCVVNYQPENLILSDKTVRLSYFREYVNPYYIMIALQSPAMQSGITNAMSGMAESQVNISQDKMKRFLLPLPPLAEQHRIVEQIEVILPMVKSL